MAKIERTLFLAAALLAGLAPALADDAKQSGSTPAVQNAQSADPVTHRAIDHPHFPKDWIPSKRIIMGVNGLTDKQKSDIQAIYDNSTARFAALDLEYHDLRKQNWEKIQNILTKDQMDTVMTDQHNLTHPHSPYPSNAQTSPMQQANDARPHRQKSTAAPQD